jgi:hypothetical protein
MVSLSAVTQRNRPACLRSKYGKCVGPMPHSAVAYATDQPKRSRALRIAINGRDNGTPPGTFSSLGTRREQ